jgi:serine/threonine-protein kinase RsbT
MIPINEESDIVHARNEAKEFAKKLGFGLVDQTRISTAVSELARNVYTYAGKGEVTIQELSNPHRGIRIEFKDEGPGIEDVELAMQDGWSSSRSMGKGLPGSKRLVDFMEINTKPGSGTLIIIEKWLS